jgi:hypothetical protein
MPTVKKYLRERERSREGDGHQLVAEKKRRAQEHTSERAQACAALGAEDKDCRALKISRE